MATKIVANGSQRDARVDLIRGLALLILISDHLPNNPVYHVMPVSWGLADMAEVFVLLSGFVFGLSLQKQRPAILQKIRILRRAAEIYIAYIITALMMIWMIRQFQYNVAANWLAENLVVNSWKSVWIDLLTGTGRVSHLSILLLYVWLLLGMGCLPIKVWKNPGRVWIGSFVVYLASQFRLLDLPTESLQDATYYRPFAWQFLFISGATFSLLPTKTRQQLTTGKGLALSLVIQGMLLLLIGLDVNIPRVLTSKSPEGVLRYLHAISGMLILFGLLPSRFSTFTERWTRIFQVCSQQTLWVYCGGALLTVPLAQWSKRASGLTEFAAINLLAWGGSIAIAMIVTRLKSALPDDSGPPPATSPVSGQL